MMSVLWIKSKQMMFPVLHEKQLILDVFLCCGWICLIVMKNCCYITVVLKRIFLGDVGRAAQMEH